MRVFDLAFEELERLGEAQLLLSENIDVVVEFILPRIEDIAFGLDRLRRDLNKFFGEFGRAATLNFGFETGDARGIGGAASANFTQL